MTNSASPIMFFAQPGPSATAGVALASLAVGSAALEAGTPLCTALGGAMASLAETASCQEGTPFSKLGSDTRAVTSKWFGGSLHVCRN